MSANKDITPTTNRSLVTRFAQKYHIDDDKLLATLKDTCFKQSGDESISNEQMAAMLIVADQHNLNPFTREIYAFPDKQNGIVPVVGIDGWCRIINEHPMCNGFEFCEAPEIVDDNEHKPCPAWMEVTIYRKDRDHPVVVREYLDEVYQGKRGNFIGPWQTHTKRMLRHKTLIQGARLAFSFSGIFDQDEALRIIDGEIIDVDFQPPTTEETANLNSTLKKAACLKSEKEEEKPQRGETFSTENEVIVEETTEPTEEEIIVDLVVKIQMLADESVKKTLTKKRGLEILTEIHIIRGRAEKLLESDELDMALDLLRSAETTLQPVE